MTSGTKTPIWAAVAATSRAAGVWVEVLDRAGQRCECTGACGSTHRKGGGRCHVLDGWPQREGLTVAPADPAVPLPAATRLAPVELRAVCPDCWSAVERRQAKRGVGDTHQAALFGEVA